VFCCAAAILVRIYHQAGAVVWSLGIAFLISALAHLSWFWRNAPRAIVATDEFLGFAAQGGDERRIPWSSIFRAAHSTRLLGMQWELDLFPTGPTILPDVGIDAGRWGTLRSVIIELAAKHGANVAVDPLSEGMYWRRN